MEKIRNSDLPNEVHAEICSMFKLKAAVAGLSMVLVCAGFLSLAGCGAGNQADQNAVMLLQKADQQRAQAQNLADLNALQASYDGLANDPGL